MIISKEQIKQSIKYLRGAQSEKTKRTRLKAQRNEIVSLEEELSKLPPVRNPRLEAIKQSLTQRRYSISSHQVAEKIIGRALSDQIR